MWIKTTSKNLHILEDSASGYASGHIETLLENVPDTVVGVFGLLEIRFIAAKYE